MSALDIAARGLARKALDATDALPGSGGSGLLGHRRSEAGAILEPVSTLLKRLDMAPSGFGALYNAGTSDYAALSAFASAMAGAGQGLARLEPKTISLGHSDSLERLNWSQSNAGLIGAGIDRTIIKNVTTTADSWSMKFGACEKVLFSDMTFHGRVGCYADANSIKSVIFNRCKFTTTSSVLHNAVQFVTDTMTSGVQFILFIDCIFENPGRMGVEIQNNGAGSTVRYGNIYFIRPRFIGAGQATAGLGMGLSLTGYGDRVELDQPWFDGNKQVHLENVGCSRLRVHDMMVRASTHPTGKSCVSMSGTRMMYDCEIDGFELVGDLAANVVERPAIDAAVMSIRSNTRIRLNRIKAAVNNAAVATKVLLLENNGANVVDATVENCDLWTNSNERMIEFLLTGGTHIVRNNTLNHTHASRTSSLVAAFGSGTVQVSANRISYSSGTAASVFAKSGTGALNVTHDNAGITTQYKAVHTIAVGQTASTLANHGLPGLPARFRCWPRGNTGGAVWASNHTTNTQIRANIPAALAAAVDVEVEAEYAW